MDIQLRQIGPQQWQAALLAQGLPDGQVVAVGEFSPLNALLALRTAINNALWPLYKVGDLSPEQAALVVDWLADPDLVADGQDLEYAISAWADQNRYYDWRAWVVQVARKRLPKLVAQMEASPAFSGVDDSIYNALPALMADEPREYLEAMERIAYEALDAEGPSSPLWVQFCLQVLKEYGEGTVTHEVQWRIYGILPAGHSQLLADMAATGTANALEAQAAKAVYGVCVNCKYWAKPGAPVNCALHTDGPEDLTHCPDLDPVDA